MYNQTIPKSDCRVVITCVAKTKTLEEMKNNKNITTIKQVAQDWVL